MQKKNMCLILVLISGAQLMGQETDQVMSEGNQSVAQSESMVNIGIAQNVRGKVAERLNTLLSDEYVLYVKTQKFHWNVVGPFFGSLHKLFNDQYDQLAGITDKVAERIRALGFKAFGTLAEFSEHSSLVENAGNNPDANGMIKSLLDDHETVIRALNDYTKDARDLGDAGTENFLADLIITHQKMAWILRVHLF